MINNSTHVNWDGHAIKLTWFPTDQYPSIEKVTSVHGICFYENKILLVHIKDRGFNHPGGHVDQGETPEQALFREIYEEGYVNGESQYLGFIEVNQEHNPQYDPEGKYPRIGYQLFYKVNVTECFPFARENESITRIWVEPSEVPFVINDHKLVNIILKEALDR
ncbi:NUDIX hydrolase [Chengkuizengella axinellae]|uniref:NUDIX domain-containing protein n=1 Tax=Chengkuizengella axinellae TaxID=3064388 RepID=A0ABT9IY14_9BACL|nr:NUDIX domain-containing protein [Chengkuizengella sp. 2205SS18-9]MDP5274203.1 NUDIX domain-containing protein [Chengkuizengella sp. 2205SS18-9]